MNIGARIHALREESRILQSDLAKKLDVSRTTISNYENGYSFPDLSTLAALSQYFDVSTDYLLGITDKKEPGSTLSAENKKVLGYYERLNTENRDYICGEMVKLYKEQSATKEGEKKTV